MTTLNNGNPIHEFTLEERRAAQAKAVEARLRNGELKRLVQKIADAKLRSTANKKRLKQLGLKDDEMTQRAVIANNIVVGAMQNDHKSIDEFMILTGEKVERTENLNKNVEMKPLIDLRKTEQKETKGGK